MTHSSQATIDSNLQLAISNFKKNPWHFILASTILLILPYAICKPISLIPIVGIWISLVSGLLFYIWLYPNFIIYLIKDINGDKSRISELFTFSNLNLGMKLFLTNIIKIMMVSCGFVCLVIPGIYLIMRLSQTTFLVIDQKQNPLLAIKTSFKMTKGIVWRIFSLIWLGIGMTGLGLLVVFIGVLVSTPIILLAFTSFYLCIKHGYNDSIQINTINE